jgi:hemerythrin superfamily protein
LPLPVGPDWTELMRSVPAPTTGDVVDLILDDHRWFEEAMRELRLDTRDREPVRADLSAVLVAHAEAEEAKVYPTLRLGAGFATERARRLADDCGSLDNVRRLVAEIKTR